MTNPDTSPETADVRDDRSAKESHPHVEHHDPAATPSDAESFGWRGWALLGVVGFSFIVAPAVILWQPPTIPRWVALVALPMLPGLLLGATAVWAALRG